MSDRHTFGPRLRRERERRGISLETLATVTNVSIDLWQGLECNDFSRWPAGIFARAFMRDYARAVGLDADDVVEEFCRLFPVGDRRTSRVIRAQAELIGQKPGFHDEPQLIPGGIDRRGTAPAQGTLAESSRVRLTPRFVAVAFDVGAVLGIAGLAAFLTPVPFWPSLALGGLVYYATGTVMSGNSPGTRAAEILQHRAPALFAVHNRRAHA